MPNGIWKKSIPLPEQAEAIVNLQLYRLTNTDIVTLEKEADALRKEITRLEGILKSDKKLMDVIKKELTRIRKLYNDERLTKNRRTYPGAQGRYGGNDPFRRRYYYSNTGRLCETYEHPLLFGFQRRKAWNERNR
ncbi:DNA gyrase subunit A [Sinobaca sp. H24]|uniref:DNA gyrase subunit A n=1 Tax=Sinobaca sp. H24 TaxID=2923376 RepID=UPI0035B2059A